MTFATEALSAFLAEHGFGGPCAQLSRAPADRGVVLLLGAAGCAALAGTDPGAPTPVRDVPEIVAVVVRRGAGEVGPAPVAGSLGEWRTTWTDAEHAAAVADVRERVARGEVYQVNVVGHRSAAASGDPRAWAGAVPGLPGAAYGGVVAGEGWAVGSASPECLVKVVGDVAVTVPVKGTRRDAPGAAEALRGSAKDRAEHVMIVDLERNDLARVARTGSVEVTALYDVTPWAGLWHAGSTVRARLREDVGVVDVLRALAPGGSVTGAPKHAACRAIGALEPVGRGPAMGAMGFLSAEGLDLGLTIRTVAAIEGGVHLWAGGGVTWSSDPEAEVAEAHAKAAPVVAALERAARAGR